MVHVVIDIVVSILWTAIFISLGIVSYIGLRNSILFVRHKARRGWNMHMSRSRVVSRRFGIAYLLYGLFYIVAKEVVSDRYDGYAAVTGYLIILVHALSLRIIHDREMLDADN